MLKFFISYGVRFSGQAQVYSTELAPHVYVQPDVQYITRPGGGPGTQTVLGLRVHVEQ